MEYQTESEFLELLAIYRARRPQTLLEIGSMTGETLRHWLAAAQPGLRAVSIDLIVPASDSRHERQTRAHAEWQEWALQAGATLNVLNADSTLGSTVATVKQLVPELDFLFIDGGHDYATVRADYLNYAPLVRPGGVIAFHDIQGLADVARFWQEISQHRSRREICHPHGWGIGVLHV